LRKHHNDPLCNVSNLSIAITDSELWKFKEYPLPESSGEGEEHSEVCRNNDLTKLLEEMIVCFFPFMND
jgi:hypothetical protein